MITALLVIFGGALLFVWALLYPRTLFSVVWRIFYLSCYFIRSFSFGLIWVDRNLTIAPKLWSCGQSDSSARLAGLCVRSFSRKHKLMKSPEDNTPSDTPSYEDMVRLLGEERMDFLSDMVRPDKPPEEEKE